MLPHHERYGRGHERPPHEEILERLDKIEETLARIDNKIRN